MSEPNTNDRIMAAIRAIINAEFPTLNYRGLFDYSIDAVNGAPPSVILDCSPVDPSLGLPPLSGISTQPSVSGMTGIPSAGMSCVVSFLDGNPTKPIIVGVQSLGVNPVARLGDQIMCFLPPALPIVGGVIVGGIPQPFIPGTVVIVSNPITGAITQGSGKAYTG